MNSTIPTIQSSSRAYKTFHSSSSARQSISKLPKAVEQVAVACLETRNVESFHELTPIQQQVIERTAITSEQHSKSAKAKMQRAWGSVIPANDMDVIEDYIARKVPLTIRITIEDLFPHLVKDPYYRSAFEISSSNHSYLSQRRVWETILFEGLYENSTVRNMDRPKYGVLNMVCNPFSDTRVSAFGSAYLLLNDDSRIRTTVATSKENSETGYKERYVGTLNNVWHLLETLSHHELVRLHDVATGRRANATVTSDSKYSEIQIHGMVDIRKDVTALVLQKSDLKDKNIASLVDEVSRQYILPVITCEEFDEMLGSNKWSTVVRERANVLYQKTMAMGGSFGLMSSYYNSRW